MLVSALAVISAATVTIVLPGPAGAQSGSPCAPGQPSGRPFGEPPGPPGSPPRQPDGRPPAYPPGKCQLLLSRSVVAAGESVGVAGSGYAPGADVKVSAAGVTLASVAADPAGAFSTDVVIPRSVPSGTHEVTAAGAGAGGGTQVLSASLTVTGGASRSASLGDALPRTGGGDGLVPMTVAGAGLLGIGSAAAVAARRRRSAPPAS